MLAFRLLIPTYVGSVVPGAMTRRTRALERGVGPFVLGFRKGHQRIDAQERQREMIFETKMDRFFTRNCYSEQERSRVKACRAYRVAAENNDAIQAQEIATQVLEGRLGCLEE